MSRPTALRGRDCFEICMNTLDQLREHTKSKAGLNTCCRLPCLPVLKIIWKESERKLAQTNALACCGCLTTWFLRRKSHFKWMKYDEIIKSESRCQKQLWPSCGVKEQEGTQTVQRTGRASRSVRKTLIWLRRSNGSYCCFCGTRPGWSRTGEERVDHWHWHLLRCFLFWKKLLWHYHFWMAYLRWFYLALTCIWMKCWYAVPKLVLLAYQHCDFEFRHL